MSNKLVWSTFKTAVELERLSPEELRAELVDYGFDADMLGDMTGEELNALLNDDVFWQIDLEDFDYNVLPMINKQTCDGIVLMVGEAETWDGKHKGGKAVFTEDLKGGDIDPDVTDVEIVDENGGLVWIGHHHDGTHRFKLYALPETDQVDFIRNCMEDAIEDELALNHEGEDYEDAEDDILENILGQFTDLDYLNDHINWSQVPNYCKPIKNLLNESLNESEDDVVTIVVDAVIDPYLYKENMDAIREFNIEPEYDIDKAHDNLTLTGTKANLVRYLKSDLYGETDEWIKEFYPVLLESLNESKLNEDFVDIKHFRLSELNSMIDKVVVFNKKVIYSNLDNYESDDEKPDFDRLGFEIEKDGDVVIPEGYTAVIKGVSSDEGYNPELYLESNGEEFEIALGWVELGEMSIIDPSLEGSLNEASSKEPKKLKKELKEIKSLVKEYGKEYLTSMPFTSYDNDPISIEYQYPEFFKIVKSFFKEMELLDKEQLNNNELLDDSWDSDIDDHDWDVLMTVCDKLVNRPGVPVQIEKIYKTGYNSFLDDDQILADREGNPDFVEEN